MRVRLVEDNPDLVMLMRHVLQDSEVEVEVTDHNYEALFTHECWEGIDVAVVDVLLGEPDFDGRDILAWLKRELPGIRRVVLSAVGNVYPELGDLADVVLTKGSVGLVALLSAIGVDPDA